MKVLLDTNVWRYLLDSGKQDFLYKLSRQFGITIAISPAIVIETLRLSNPSLRKKIINLQTRNCWERLLPDAYLQSEDVKRQMIKFHPEWQLLKPNFSLYKKLRYDWIRTRGGFWTNAMNSTESVAARYNAQDANHLELVRESSRNVRSSVLKDGRKIMQSSSLNDVKGYWKTVSGETSELEGWRVFAESTWITMLTLNDSAFRQWLGCDINIDLLLNYYAEQFVNFWKSEVQAELVPREWLRFAVFALQSERKVTDGNPTDSAIAMHLVDVDAVISADKNFILMINTIQSEAPFRTARGYLVDAGLETLDQVFNLISQESLGKSSASNVRTQVLE